MVEKMVVRVDSYGICGLDDSMYQYHFEYVVGSCFRLSRTLHCIPCLLASTGVPGLDGSGSAIRIRALQDGLNLG